MVRWQLIGVWVVLGWLWISWCLVWGKRMWAKSSVRVSKNAPVLVLDFLVYCNMSCHKPGSQMVLCILSEIK